MPQYSMQAHETCEPWIGVLLDEAGGRSPLPAENELGEALPTPGCEVTFPVLLRERVRAGGVPNRQAGQRLHPHRDSVEFTSLVGQNADHLVDEQPTGRRPWAFLVSLPALYFPAFFTPFLTCFSRKRTQIRSASSTWSRRILPLSPKTLAKTWIDERMPPSTPCAKVAPLPRFLRR